MLIISLLSVILVQSYMIIGFFGMGISIALLVINFYTRASNQRIIEDLDRIILKILMK